MLDVSARKGFRRDLKLARKRGKDLAKLEALLETLKQNMPLAARYHPHRLTGEWEGCLECHIEPDWLLIYAKTKAELILIRTGTHSDLFG